MIPACNILSREAELDHVSAWAQMNYLKLNRAKSAEIVVTDSRRRPQFTVPPELPDICRVTSTKVLGVTLTNHLSVSDHVRDVLRYHGMNEEELRLVYKSVVLAKLMYASPAWWGFATAADKKRIEDFVQRGVRLGLYLANDPTPTELAIDSDDNLFGSVLYNCHHVLKQLLPDKTDHQYNLRHRRHNLSLSVKHDDRNFLTRQLFKDAY